VACPGNLVAIRFERQDRQWSILGEYPGQTRSRAR